MWRKNLNYVIINIHKWNHNSIILTKTAIVIPDSSDQVQHIVHNCSKSMDRQKKSCSKYDRIVISVCTFITVFILFHCYLLFQNVFFIEDVKALFESIFTSALIPHTLSIDRTGSDVTRWTGSEALDRNWVKQNAK